VYPAFASRLLGWFINQLIPLAESVGSLQSVKGFRGIGGSLDRCSLDIALITTILSRLLGGLYAAFPFLLQFIDRRTLGDSKALDQLAKVARYI